MIRAKVVYTWQEMSQSQRKELRRLAMRAKDAGMRCRCKVVLALVQGKTPTMIAQGGLCAKSQVYRVAERFITEGLAGLADRREDNGERKITPVYESELLRLVEQSPQEFGYRRPTWTQELLILVLAERVEISISVSAMSRLLRRSGIGLKRPKPILVSQASLGRRRIGRVDCGRLSTWSRISPPHLSEVVLYVDEVDIHLNPKIGPDCTKRGRQKMVLTPGCNEKPLISCRRVEPQDAPAHLCRRRAEEQPVVLGIAPQVGHEGLSERQTDSCRPRQLRYPRQFAKCGGWQ